MQANGYRVISTPLGFLGLVASSKGLKAVLGPHDDRELIEQERADILAPLNDDPVSEILNHWADVLSRYTSGETLNLSGPLDMDGGTDFQRSVWQALTEIPVGTVRTYGDVAHAIGRPKAARAVGQAVGSNPLGIVVP